MNARKQVETSNGVAGLEVSLCIIFCLEFYFTKRVREIVRKNLQNQFVFHLFLVPYAHDSQHLRSKLFLHTLIDRKY